MDFKIVIETLTSIALFINAALFLPQIKLLLKTKKSDELSLTTFLGFNLIQLLTLLHGFIGGDRILVYGMSLSLLTCGSISFLIIYYRHIK